MEKSLRRSLSLILLVPLLTGIGCLTVSDIIEFENGMQTHYADLTYWDFTGSEPEIKGFSEPQRVVDVDVRSVVLRRNWVNPDNGMVFKKGTEVRMYANDRYEFFTLAAPWTDADTGRVFAAGSPLFFYENGNLKQAILHEDWENPAGTIRFLAGHPVGYYDDSEVRFFTTADELSLDGQVALQAGTQVELYPDGSIKRATFARPWRDPASGTEYAAGTEYEF